MGQTLNEDKKRVLNLLEEAYNGRGSNLKHSADLAEQALTISRKLNDKALMGKSLNQLSLYYMIMGEYQRSTFAAEEAIGFFEDLKDDRGIAESKYNIAGIYYRTDNYHLGLVYLVDCLATYKKYNDYHNQSRVGKSLGTIYEYFGDQKNAIKSYQMAIDTALKAGDQNLESNAYNPLSGILLKQDKVKEAMEMIEKSVAIKKQTGDVRGLAFALYGRGKVYAKKKEYDNAEADFKETIQIHLEMGEKLGMGMVYHKLGTLYFETGRLNEAKATLEKALEFSNQFNIVIIKFKCNYLLYKIYKQEENPIKALYYLEQYLKEKEAVINTQTLKIIENYELITKMESLEKEAQAQKERAEIIEKKDKAEEAARMKQEFLSTMSHEIRTPLNAVITITSLLSDNTDDEDRKLLHSLKYASNNLLLIINDILDYTKLDIGKVQLEKRPVVLVPLLENIRRTYEALADEKNISLHLYVDTYCNEAYELDETKMAQILGNLVSNAIKFTEEGSVDIVVEKREGDDKTDVIRFKVIDTGLGIPKHNQIEIFESFSQPKSITTRKHGGSGLGLAIVKKLVGLYGGDIAVESKVGKGSTFYFDIKAVKTLAPGKAKQISSDELRGKTLLLAEDNKVNAMVAMKLLSNWGIVAEHAEDGFIVVEKSLTKKFDYILMDIHMPEKNGFDATKEIRQEENPNANTPIFALTADVTAENEEGYAHFFNGFLRKPIEIDKLFEALAHS